MKNFKAKGDLKIVLKNERYVHLPFSLFALWPCTKVCEFIKSGYPFAPQAVNTFLSRKIGVSGTKKNIRPRPPRAELRVMR